MFVNWELCVTGKGSDDLWRKQGFSGCQGSRQSPVKESSALTLVRWFGLGSSLKTPKWAHLTDVRYKPHQEWAQNKHKDSRSGNNSWFITSAVKVQYFCCCHFAILIFYKICDPDHSHPDPCLGSHVWHSALQLEENVSSDHIFSLFKTFPEDLTVIRPLPWLLVSLSIFLLCSLVPLSCLAPINLQSWGGPRIKGRGGVWGEGERWGRWQLLFGSSTLEPRPQSLLCPPLLRWCRAFLLRLGPSSPGPFIWTKTCFP